MSACSVGTCQAFTSAITASMAPTFGRIIGGASGSYDEEAIGR